MENTRGGSRIRGDANQVRQDNIETLTFKTHAPLGGLCDNLTSAFVLVTSLEEASTFGTVYRGIQGKSKLQVTSVLRDMSVDNNRLSVKMGELARHKEGEEREPANRSSSPGRV